MPLPDLLPDVDPKNPPKYEPDEFDDYEDEDYWRLKYWCSISQLRGLQTLKNIIRN